MNVRVCALDFAMKALEYRNDFDTDGWGRFVVVHQCSTFSDCCRLATPLNKVENMPKLGGGFAARGRQNEAIETKFGK